MHIAILLQLTQSRKQSFINTGMEYMYLLLRLIFSFLLFWNYEILSLFHFLLFICVEFMQSIFQFFSRCSWECTTYIQGSGPTQKVLGSRLSILIGIFLFTSPSSSTNSKYPIGLVMAPDLHRFLFLCLMKVNIRSCQFPFNIWHHSEEHLLRNKLKIK